MIYEVEKKRTSFKFRWPQQQHVVLPRQEVRQQELLRQDQRMVSMVDPRQDPRSEQRLDLRTDFEGKQEARMEAYPGQFASLGLVSVG